MAILINDQPLSHWGAEALNDWTVGGTPLDTSYFIGRYRSNWTLTACVPGMRAISFSVVFTGTDRGDCSLKKSQFDKACYGKIEITGEDGYLYTCYPKSLGAETIVGINLSSSSAGAMCKTQAKYSFVGIKHGPLVTYTGGAVTCQSTMPYTDAKISVTVSSAAENYVISWSDGNATSQAVFANVEAGEVLTLDGISGRILRNNAPSAQTVTFVNLPRLSPGVNTITSPDQPTIEYYPAYI